ncbi:MAG: hypothetical protein JSV36_22010 [Anaerolineae bacterium]|nr:MAG: hypothetical protein JSV36_22010 [Anaerolineae bacterium]
MLAPDFERLRTALLLQGEPDYVPKAELWIDRSLMSRFMGQPVETWEQEVAFWAAAGYDYAHIVPAYQFPKKVKEGSGGHQFEGLVTCWEGFERYPWPAMEQVDWTPVQRALVAMPPGMRLISGTLAGVFEETWMIMGFETMALSVHDQPELLRAVTDKVGSFIVALVERVVALEGVGAVWHSDDIAYKTSTMLSPEAYRRYIFPWYERIGDLCRQHGLPFLYHSDGSLWRVLDDLKACGFQAIHPIEPLGMDILELKCRYGEEFCLIGNIGLEYELTLGTPADVEAKVKERIRQLAPGGGYCCGSSNTIPAYVPYENYLAMIQAIEKYGRYPIRL